MTATRSCRLCLTYRGPRLPPPSRGRVPPCRGRRPSRGSAAPRCAALTCGRVCHVLPVRGRVCGRKRGLWLEARRPFPSPGVARSHASCERLSVVRSRCEFAAGGPALCAGTVVARLVLVGAFRPGCEPLPTPARVVAGGRANERMVDGRLEEAAAASLWRLCLLFEGSACAVLPRWRGFPGARATGGTASRSCALGGTGPASRASRGRPVCLWRWDPRVVYPVARPGPVPCLGARSRSLRPGVLPLVC